MYPQYALCYMPVHGWSRMTCNVVYIKSFLRKLEAIHLNGIPEVNMNLKCSHSCQKVWLVEMICMHVSQNMHVAVRAAYLVWQCPPLRTVWYASYQEEFNFSEMT